MATYKRGWRRAAEGEQKGTMFVAGGAEQIVSLGLSASEHFSSALQAAAAQPFPLDAPPAAETDLEFAAESSASRMADLHAFRGESYKAVAALAERLQPTSAHLRQFQCGAVAQVAARMHIGLLAVAVVVMGWPDTTLPLRFITGFSSLGWVERSGVLREIEPVPPISRAELLAGRAEAFQQLEARPESAEEAEFLLGECRKDLERGFAGPIMTMAEANNKFGEGGWLPLPRFEIVQANGKRRPIDDGARFNHNKASGFVETIECCSALQPAIHARLLIDAMKKFNGGAGPHAGQLETGGEDMPNAYRWVPALPSEGGFNVVAVTDPTSGTRLFQ